VTNATEGDSRPIDDPSPAGARVRLPPRRAIHVESDRHARTEEPLHAMHGGARSVRACRELVGERKVALTVSSSYFLVKARQGRLMRLVARWGAAVLVSGAGFALAWWLCQEQIRLDEGAALGIAGAVLAILLAIAAWWAPQAANSGEAVPDRGDAAAVTNTISGGSQYGPVLQGRDFTGLTFGASPSPPAADPKDADVD
jgi:hypothetical protein